MTAMPVTVAEPRVGRRWLNALLILAAAAALIVLAAGIEPREWPPEPYVEVVLDGAYYRVSPERLPELGALTVEQLTAGQQASLAAVEARVGAELDRLFAAAAARIPSFLDDYYTLRGEYARLAAAAVSLA